MASTDVPQTSVSSGENKPNKGTLEFALRPYRTPVDTLREKHGEGVLGMITICLGVTPRNLQFLDIWPPAYECLTVLVPNLWNIPFCDFGIGTIDASLRSLVAYVVSREYGCGYCAAHCATIGTVWRGNSVFLTKNAKAMDPDPDPAVFSPKELAAINISKKLGAVPAQVTADDIRSMASVYTELEQEAVVNSAVVMGFLNKWTDTLGTVLELEQLEMGLAQLAPSGWVAGQSYDAEADAELMAQDVIEAAKRDERKAKSGIFSYAKMLIDAKLADRRNLRQTPTTEQTVSEECKELAGFVPYYLLKMRHSQAKKAFMYAFKHQLCKASEEVPTSLKHLMCYICATKLGNTILRAHYAFMAHRNGVSIDRLIGSTSTEVSETADVTIDAKQDAAIRLAQESSKIPPFISPVLIELLMRLYSPAGVVELITTMSVAMMYHRFTAVYMPTEYEPGVLEFVRENGAKLNIDTEHPCTAEQAKWETIAREVRSSGSAGR